MQVDETSPNYAGPTRPAYQVDIFHFPCTYYCYFVANKTRYLSIYFPNWNTQTTSVSTHTHTSRRRQCGLYRINPNTNRTDMVYRTGAGTKAATFSSHKHYCF